jgi:hypothetical protein
VVTIEVDREWLTLQEAARLTGKSSSALRGAIQRRKLEKIRKETGAIGEYSLIHRDELSKLKSNRTPSCEPGSRPDQDRGPRERAESSGESQDAIIEDVEYEFEEDPVPQNGSGTWVNMVTLEYYDSQRDKWERERSNLEQGIMMYRFKYEELERRLKVLPAPPELVSYRVGELEQKLEDEKKGREDVVKGLQSTLEAREREKLEALRELSRKLQEEEKKKEEIVSSLQTTIEEKEREQETLRALQTKLQEEEERSGRSIVELCEKLQEEERINGEIRKDMERLMAELERENKRSWWKKLLFMKLW